MLAPISDFLHHTFTANETSPDIEAHGNVGVRSCVCQYQTCIVHSLWPLYLLLNEPWGCGLESRHLRYRITRNGGNSTHTCDTMGDSLQNIAKYQSCNRSGRH